MYVKQTHTNDLTHMVGSAQYEQQGTPSVDVTTITSYRTMVILRTPLSVVDKLQNHPSMKVEVKYRYN